ncbi:MAG: TIGR00341 family protein [Bacteroidetes bacterium]|nr:TIGR00341 family protein [Bacteroidota bacterium]
MQIQFLNNFRIDKEKEDYKEVIENIEKGVVFRGTNLWVLIFAIFIASLGLNVNSTAVIIGAMLVSPLMGPIIGMGLGVGINDLALVKKAFRNLALAVSVSLATSTLYFLLSPINEAHSEILARTSPNIYDLLIAVFGGLAGILAISSKQKGNVIPGVAIATALMPPLCTAGYGLATLQYKFFFGAFYLFFINSVFIGLATLATVRVLKFPYKHMLDEQAETRAKRIIAVLVVITFIPSIYFGYDIVQQQRFAQRAESFIDKECNLPGDYLLNNKLYPNHEHITLVYGGKQISDSQVTQLKQRMLAYNLDSTSLTVQQGFAYLEKDKMTTDVQQNRYAEAIAVREQQIAMLQAQIDTANTAKQGSAQIYKELKVNYPTLTHASINQAVLLSDSSANNKEVVMAVLYFSKPISKDEKAKVQNWLNVRMARNDVMLVFQ